MGKWIAAAVVLVVVVVVVWIRRRRPVWVVDENEEELEVKLVDAQTAARRILCLMAIHARTEIEVAIVAASRGGPDLAGSEIRHQEKRDELIKSELQRNGVWDSLSQEEKALLQKPLGKWKEQEILDGSWRQESLVALAWALNLFDQIPPYDKQVDMEELAARLPLPKTEEQFIAGARLRPEEEIGQARDVAELWLWRARTTQLQKEPKRYPPPEGLTYEQIIAVTAEQAGKDSLFEPVDDDFPVRGKAYAKLTDEEWAEVHSIAAERLFGLNWLCGYADDWDEVPLGT